MDRRVLFISPKSLFVSKYEQSAVAIVFDYASAELGLAPGLSLGVHMEPDEAVDRNVSQPYLSNLYHH
jgi:hypothetical protein